MMRTAMALVLAGATAFTGGLVQADSTVRREHLEGEYAGVTPGVRPLAIREGHATTHKATPHALLWLGFAANPDGGATLWFQTAAATQADQRVDGQALIVFLPGVTRLIANTRRAIETQYFDNPLARVTTRTVRKQRARKGVAATPAGVEVRIQFKNPRDAAPGALRVATEADGLSYTYLDFGPGTDLPSS